MSGEVEKGTRGIHGLIAVSVAILGFAAGILAMSLYRSTGSPPLDQLRTEHVEEHVAPDDDNLDTALHAEDAHTTAPLPDVPPALVVAVTGAVRRPGVYRFSEGERVDDAIRRAGGVEDFAEMNDINIAARLIDDTTLHIPAARHGAPASYRKAAMPNPARYTRSGWAQPVFTETTPVEETVPSPVPKQTDESNGKNTLEPRSSQRSGAPARHRPQNGCPHR